MNEAQILLAQEPIQWSDIPQIPISNPIRPHDANVEAYGQICYTEDYLAVHLHAREKEIRAEERGLLGMPCRDSCLEFFLRPCPKDLRYLNFEFNPNACLYLGFGSGSHDLCRIVLSESKQETLFCPRVRCSEAEWELTFRIPYSFIRQFFPSFSPESGGTLRANFYKCAELVETPHFLAWNPILRQGRYLFHTPEEFGMLRFE